MMRGVGGPLLCISDLLSDVGEDNNGVGDDRGLPPGAAGVSDLPASELPRLFQQNFDELKRALDGADPCWTALTLKLCSALETANKLVDSANSRAASLSEQVQELDKVVDRRVTAVAAVEEAIQGSF
ncbi:uncharacterized protein LOC127256857 isoform X1 [Andrographis paniculata]|uniref:uncharacterized protein LOC127256857 isoform X1 n=1 Tax=Andrographis paniculata TaxID=175694 RepID=UPI0021E7A037|nr:uncharacterized protein LOC127256857 isoform X1 [Andrographis paniculata]